MFDLFCVFDAHIPFSHPCNIHKCFDHNNEEWASRITETNGVQIRPPPAGNRIIVKLYWDIAPLACENFSTLCRNGDTSSSNTNKKPKPAPIGECGKPLTYKDSIVHRVVPGFVMQGGDFVFGNGSGGESIFNGKKFKDERPGLMLKHDKKGVLSMGNSGKNSNTSQFFITFGPAPQCDGKHVIFGEVVSGWEVLTAVEATGTKSGNPSVPVEITACGVYEPLHTPAAGYWFNQPDDSYEGSSPVFMCRPRVAVLVPNFDIGKKFEKVLGTFATPNIISLDNSDIVESGEAATTYIDKLLSEYAIDAVLIAPACQAQAPSQLPPAWKEVRNDLEISLSDVVMVSKPIGSVAALKKSWVGKVSWNLEG